MGRLWVDRQTVHMGAVLRIHRLWGSRHGPFVGRVGPQPAHGDGQGRLCVSTQMQTIHKYISSTDSLLHCTSVVTAFMMVFRQPYYEELWSSG